MAPAVPRLSLSLSLRPSLFVSPCRLQPARASIHSNAQQPLMAKVVPVYGTGPPPDPPLPTHEHGDPDVATVNAGSRAARRRRQAEMLKQARDIRSAAAAKKDRTVTPTPGSDASKSGGTTGMKRRFWKDVHVQEVDGAHQVALDSRALKRPNSTQPIRIPLSKPHLASALALEWDQLMSATQALKQHLVPLTSLISRAIDIAEDDAAHAASGQTTTPAPIRAAIATSLLRYLDTDSLLCWAPPADPADPTSANSALDAEGKSLRDRQEEAATGIVAFLTSRVWPGVALVPVLDEHSIMPRPQAPGTREVVQGWVLGLSGWELAGLERATLAQKSLLGGARLVAEWSEDGAGVVRDADGGASGKHCWGVDQAAHAASIEVDWQIRRWGEVEDTHDVEREDLRRQLGSVILLVSGVGATKSKL
ncbi:ATP12-domain-containing protein [Podospora appendiculata]|uniref:ATP12-domain-containing protein n=1 Tax=Podospora appendiculata TaxID=314037 RepID=A0AAE0XJD5_9PEZI|nr:ATP12-domain-containing protein [Podospora appendiculata]